MSLKAESIAIKDVCNSPINYMQPSQVSDFGGASFFNSVNLTGASTTVQHPTTQYSPGASKQGNAVTSFELKPLTVDSMQPTEMTGATVDQMFSPKVSNNRQQKKSSFIQPIHAKEAPGQRFMTTVPQSRYKPKGDSVPATQRAPKVKVDMLTVKSFNSKGERETDPQGELQETKTTERVIFAGQSVTEAPSKFYSSYESPTKTSLEQSPFDKSLCNPVMDGKVYLR